MGVCVCVFTSVRLCWSDVLRPPQDGCRGVGVCVCVFTSVRLCWSDVSTTGWLSGCGCLCLCVHFRQTVLVRRIVSTTGCRGVGVCVCVFTSATSLFDEIGQTVLVRRIVSTDGCRGVGVCVCVFTSATSLFDEISQTVLIRRIVSTARSVCLSTYSQTFDSQLVRCGVSTAGSVCSPQPDLCWTRAVRLTAGQTDCVHCWICLSVRHNQTFVGQGQSDSQLVRRIVSTAGSLCSPQPGLYWTRMVRLCWSDVLCPLLDLSGCVSVCNYVCSLCCLPVFGFRVCLLISYVMCPTFSAVSSGSWCLVLLLGSVC